MARKINKDNDTKIDDDNSKINEAISNVKELIGENKIDDMDVADLTAIADMLEISGDDLGKEDLILKINELIVETPEKSDDPTEPKKKSVKKNAKKSLIEKPTAKCPTCLHPMDVFQKEINGKKKDFYRCLNCCKVFEKRD